MPMMKKLLLACLAAGTLILAVWGIVLSPETDRGPASDSALKAKRQGVTMGKMDRPFDVFIDPVKQLPPNGDGEVRLIGFVFTNEALATDLHFKWTLPDGVDLVAGELEDSWANVPGQSERSSEIIVTGLSAEELALIHFEAYIQPGDARVSAVAVYSTQPERVNYQPKINTKSTGEAHDLRHIHF